MFLVCYDIENDTIRTNIAKLLEGWGRRVQYSVFECDIDTQEMDILANRLAETLKSPENGGIRIYALCAKCIRSSYGLGDTPPPEEVCLIV